MLTPAGRRLLALFGFLFATACPATCQQLAVKTALDAEGCALKAVADSAAAALGDVSQIAFSGGTDQAAVDQLAQLGETRGTAAVTCALNSLLLNLAGPGAISAARRSAIYSSDPREKAIRRLLDARDRLAPKHSRLRLKVDEAQGLGPCTPRLRAG